MKHKTLKLSVLSIALTSLLTACGGGGGSDGGSTTPPFASKTVSGQAVDFYLKNATVTLTDCLDDKNAPIVVNTGDKGEFTFKTTEKCQSSAMTVTGGIDIATGLNFTGTLKIKKTDLQNFSSAAVVVSPLTTLQVYAGSANIESLLTNLGLSAETLDKLKASNFNLAAFDPVKDASAKDMATIFVIQQLANQIEDSLQNISKSDGSPALDVSKATELAFGALVKQLSAGKLFTDGTTQLNATALQSLLDTVQTDATKAINDNTIVIDNSVLDQISHSVSTVADALNTVIATGGNLTAEALQQKLQNNEGGIKDTLQAELLTPVYSDFKLANYDLTQIKGSATAPLAIGLSQLTSNLNISFKMKNATTSLNDTIKLAFALHGVRGTAQKDLNVTVNSIQASFDNTGNLEKAIIPAGAKITISSNINSLKNATFTIDQEIKVNSSNGAISLQTLIDSNATLKNYYNQYYSELATGDAINVTAYVLPISYVIDADLKLTTSQADFNGESFSAPSMTAYFKLN